MKLKPYAELKDTNVKCLGSVPKHWQLTKIKFLSTFVKGKNPEQLYDEKGKGMYSYLSMDYLRGKSSELFAPLTNNLTLVDDEQTLIIWDGSNAGEFVKAKQGILSSTMGAAFTKKVNKQFFWYLCLSIEPEIRKRTNGMGIPHVSGDFLKNFLVAMPNLGEQSKLAAYLDHETSKIDTLIAKQEKLIELLEEKRKSIISHAVTKGLDPNAKMKDSGVEWLGEVPEHWGIAKIRWLSNKIGTGGTPSNHIPTKEFKDDYIDWFTTSDFSNDLHLKSATKKVSADAIKENDLKIFPENSVLLVGIGSIGKVGYITHKASANQQINFITLNKNKVMPKYLAYYLWSRESYINQLACSSILQIINQQRTGDIYTSFPNIVEQKEIISFLDKESSKIDKLIAKQKQLIEKLKEYRSSIISHAVTGKIDVRDFVLEKEVA